MRCSKHRARKVASRTLPSTAEGSCGYPRGGVDRTPHAAVLPKAVRGDERRLPLRPKLGCRALRKTIPGFETASYGGNHDRLPVRKGSKSPRRPPEGSLT